MRRTWITLFASIWFGWVLAEPFIVVGVSSPEEKQQARTLLNLIDQPDQMKQKAQESGFYWIEHQQVFYLVPLSWLKRSGFYVISRLLQRLQQEPIGTVQEFAQLDPETQAVIKKWIQDQAPLRQSERSLFLSQDHLKVALRFRLTLRVRMEGKSYLVLVDPFPQAQPALPPEFKSLLEPSGMSVILPWEWSPELPIEGKEQGRSSERVSQSQTGESRELSLLFSRALPIENQLVHAEAFFAHAKQLIQDSQKAFEEEVKRLSQEQLAQALLLLKGFPDPQGASFTDLSPEFQQRLCEQLLPLWRGEQLIPASVGALQQALKNAQVQMLGSSIYLSVGLMGLKDHPQNVTQIWSSASLEEMAKHWK